MVKQDGERFPTHEARNYQYLNQDLECSLYIMYKRITIYIRKLNMNNITRYSSRSSSHSGGVVFFPPV
jgi:hypothetical protein